ncbi:hypothetical protein LRS10_20305 [Phenylobacterium sp. J426]|uniref:hypothetical protein n=1 Tax=Phenylobacterium sp. J426 TaxID=2898439 RepID=UPI002151BC11|nr:hypothetical protein [Phenylobacterium sp. J426]MCR5876284.1 hypothetical protein [Phenylobacterium sp. J426]
MRAAVSAVALAGMLGLAACASNNDRMAEADVGTSMNTSAAAPAYDPAPAPAPAATPAPADTGSAADTTATTRAGERG